jgi:hypothetical protein
MRSVIVAIIVAWLVIGFIAAGQRHYFTNSKPTCATTGTTVVTVIAGPLNYLGANPKIKCKAPQPSK